MSPETVNMVQFILQATIILGGMIWTVSKIRSTTEVLNNTILHLTQAITKLELAQAQLVEKLFEHESRISVLEASETK